MPRKKNKRKTIQQAKRLAAQQEAPKVAIIGHMPAGRTGAALMVMAALAAKQFKSN